LKSFNRKNGKRPYFSRVFMDKSKTKRHVLAILIGCALLVYGLAHRALQAYPDSDTMLPQMRFNPRQVPTDHPPFNLALKDKEYILHPLFEYELTGMIVSYNQNSLIWAIDHWLDWEDFINVKDICVIWGDNVTQEVYKGMTFINGSYTCYPRFKQNLYADVGWKFRPYQLSNNHLLAEKSPIKRRLLEAKRGDQIYLRGYLVQYGAVDGTVIRNTSISRYDNKCESIYVTDFQILKKAHPLARLVQKCAVATLFICLSLLIWYDRYWVRFAEKYARPRSY
jgi:hypothetical protein